MHKDYTMRIQQIEKYAAANSATKKAIGILGGIGTLVFFGVRARSAASRSKCLRTV